MPRKCIGVVICLSLLVFQPAPAKADIDVVSQATNLIGQLNPINLALGPLVDNAISSGNFALAQRLEQLRAIIQEALYSLDQIAQKRITQVNASAEGRITQLQNAVNQNLQLFNAIASGQVKTINQDAADRIQQFGNTTANLVEVLPIPAQPLPNVPQGGFSLVKDPNGPATLFVTGAGLFKGGTKPQAYLLAGNNSDNKGFFSHAGTEVPVVSASMGLVEIAIPKESFPSQGTIEKTLQLHLRSGNILPTTVEPTFPLLLCSKLPQYVVQVVQSASGQYWERERIPYPKPAGRPDGVYIDDNGSNNSADVCAEDYGGWSVDPEAADNGLEVGSYGSHADGSAVYKNNPHPGCYHLYAGKDSSGGGNAWVAGVYVHLRRLKAGACGSPVPYPQVDLRYGSANSVTTNPGSVLSQCVSTAAGATVTPVLQTNLAVKDIAGKVVDQVNLSPSIPSTLLDGELTATDDQFGLIRITLDSNCRRKTQSFAVK